MSKKENERYRKLDDKIISQKKTAGHQQNRTEQTRKLLAYKQGM